MAFDKIVGVDGTTYNLPDAVRTKLSSNITTSGQAENTAVAAVVSAGITGKANTVHTHTISQITDLTSIDSIPGVEIGVVGPNGVALADKHTLQYEASTTTWRNKVASGGVTVSATPPSSPNKGDAWFDSNDGTLYVWYVEDAGATQTSQWVQVQSNSALEGTILSRLGAVESITSAMQLTPQYSPNYLINGGFDILQRAQSVNITGSHFSYKTSDRWLLAVSATGSTNVDNAIIGFPDGGAIVDGIDVPYFMRWTVNTVGTATAYGMINRIEDVRTLAGDTVTLSFYVRGTQTSTIRPVLIQYFGSGGSSDVTINPTSTATTTFNTTWTRKSFTFTVPSVAAKTIGSGSFIQAQIDALSISTGTMEIAAVQLEQGSTATPFRRAGHTLQGELAACQRYYYKMSGSAMYQYPFLGGLAAVGGTALDVSLHLPVTMRAASTDLALNNLLVYYYANGTAYSGGVTTVVYANENKPVLRYTHGSSVFTGGGTAMFMVSSAGTNPYIAINAEL